MQYNNYVHYRNKMRDKLGGDKCNMREIYTTITGLHFCQYDMAITYHYDTSEFYFVQN